MLEFMGAAPMSSLTRCNFCLLQDLRHFAASTHRDLTTQPAPRPEFPDGVDVLIGGVFSAWLAILPTECHCGD